MTHGRLARRMARRLARRVGRATRRRLRHLAAAAAAAAALLGTAAAPAAAQVAPRPTPTRPAPPTARPRAATDTVRRDTTARRPTDAAADTSARADTTELIRWAPGDSVLEALRARPGYTSTRYQGSRVIFDASGRVLRLNGDPAAVERGQTQVVADTIVYNDSTGIVTARRGSPTDSVVLRDPERGSDDLVAEEVEYSLAARRGVVRGLATSVESGERWFVSGGRAAVVSDTGDAPQRVYARAGSITSCDETVPHYHFQAQELKVVGRSALVARPAVLYIYDVPVMWLPFVFQDLRSGRRSGILSPRLGVSELVRNSPSYRRHVENIGYYFALSDYMDATAALDWRSSSNATASDPGWMRYSGEWRYRWLDRFLNGRFFVSHQSLSAPVSSLSPGGSAKSSNTSLSWQHNQEFSARTRFNTNLNYETSTSVRQATAFNPYAATATINSQANFQTERGPFSLSLGGSQTQYSGREDVTRNFPSLNVSAKPINLASWLLWTPTLAISNNETINGQPLGAFAYRYFTNAAGNPDSTAQFRNTRNSSLQFGTPLRIFNFDWRNSVSVNEALNDFPDVRPVYGTVTTSAGRDSTVVLENRVYARTFLTGVDWQTGIDLPQLFGGSWNVTPRVDIVNIESGAPLLVRTERTGNRFISQGKRLQYGVSSSPTLFGLFPGFGSVTRFRHSLTPVVSYSYAPEAQVAREFRDALNLSPDRSYLGGLAQSRVSLNLSQTLEAKLRGRGGERAAAAAGDTTGAVGTTGSVDAEGRKIKLLSLNFSPIEYDFVLADSLKKRGRAGWEAGFTTQRFSYSARSDLVPGLNLDVGYSLFEGTVPSDTARFKPYRESVSLSFALNRNSGIFAAFNRLFGRAGEPVSDPTAGQGRDTETATDTTARRLARQPFAGEEPFGRGDNTFGGGLPTGQGWQATFSFSSTRQRPIVGSNVVNLTGTQICAPFQNDPIGFSQCTADPITFSQRFGGGALLPGVDPNGLPTTSGGQVFRTPPITTLQSNTSFAITPKWSGTWSTTYDFRENQFASHVVSLVRELHDWNATFAFTQAPNGNFAFNFYVALKAQPEIKFNYDRQSIRDVQPGR